MHALILAAVVTIAPTPSGPTALDCLGRQQIPTSSAQPLRAQRLGSLPDANEIRAVLRTVNGCSYQEVVGFNVSTHAPAPAGGLHLNGWTGTLVPDGARATPTTHASR